MTGSDFNKPDNSDDMLAAELALGLLEPEEAKAVRDRALQDSDLANAIRSWTSKFGQLMDEAAEIPAPEGAQERLMARLEREVDEPRAAVGPTPIVEAPARSTLWNSLAFWRGFALTATGAACVLALVLFGPVLTGSVGPTSGEDEGSSQLVATLNPEQSGSYLITLASAGTIAGTTLADFSGEERVPELWLVPDEGPTLSLGLLPQGGSTELTIPDDLVSRVIEGALLAITLEPPGGAPGGIATGPIVATGTLMASN